MAQFTSRCAFAKTWLSVKRSNNRQFPFQFPPSLFKKENLFSLLILLNLSPGCPFTALNGG